MKAERAVVRFHAGKVRHAAVLLVHRNDGVTAWFPDLGIEEVASVVGRRPTRLVLNGFRVSTLTPPASTRVGDPLRYALEGEVLDPVEKITVQALQDGLTARGLVVDDEALAAASEMMLRCHGATLDLVPDFLLLERPADGWSILQVPEGWLVRTGSRHGWAASPDHLAIFAAAAARELGPPAAIQAVAGCPADAEQLREALGTVLGAIPIATEVVRERPAWTRLGESAWEDPELDLSAPALVKSGHVFERLSRDLRLAAMLGLTLIALGLNATTEYLRVETLRRAVTDYENQIALELPQAFPGVAARADPGDALSRLLQNADASHLTSVATLIQGLNSLSAQMNTGLALQTVQLTSGQAFMTVTAESLESLEMLTERLRRDAKLQSVSLRDVRREPDSVMGTLLLVTQGHKP